jgi:signal transduction histidine kinase
VLSVLPTFLACSDAQAIGTLCPAPRYRCGGPAGGRLRAFAHASDREVALLSRWSIWNKLLLGVAMLCLIVMTLTISSIWGVTAYRRLVRTISNRAAEMPLAERLTRGVDGLRLSVSRIRQWPDQGGRTDYHPVAIREEFRSQFLELNEVLGLYRAQLASAERDPTAIGDNRDEWEFVREMQRTLKQIDHLNNEEDWILQSVELDLLGNELETLHQLASGLPSRLHDRMYALKDDVRGEYHTLMVVTGTTALLAFLMLALLSRFYYEWVVRPLRILLGGSRQVAEGDFNHRIHLNTHDEMAELAGALNDMTARFQEIRDDLNRQVKQRTKEVVRSEQLASVGFLAAGVAHEINNPLASIAWSAEALEARLHGILYPDTTEAAKEPNGDLDVLRRYLRRIQDEAFRCKGITERLLDFSRLGDVEHQEADLGELTRDVIDMIRHLGRYRNKRIEYVGDERVLARVNAQEIKQVVLNLLTNALDSLDPEGVVEVEVGKVADQAQLRVTDNGCGMTEEVLEHLFEPFFTRRRDGQGTGLGLSISYRIVADHGGQLSADSTGPGQGSTFRVALPIVQHEKANERKPQAA